jgi:hypothetical protein
MVKEAIKEAIEEADKGKTRVLDTEESKTLPKEKRLLGTTDATFNVS